MTTNVASGTHNFKVVLLGEGCVGKTSLLLRYTEDKFNDKHLTTLCRGIISVYIMTTNVASGTHNFKVVLLGEGCVGKTSLLLRYIEDKFNDKHLTTLQATFLNKRLNINGKRINLSIWDTAGQEKFHALGPIYYRNSNGAILVYDITDEDSFGKVKNWVKELKKMLGSDIVLTIAGNKIDLEHERTVPLEEAESYANMVGARHFYTSAKLNQGVEDLFLDLTKEMLEKSEQNSQMDVSRTSQVLVVDDELTPVQTSCCSGNKSN